MLALHKSDTSAEKETMYASPWARDLVDVFSGKEAETLPPHRGNVDHHIIPLEEGAKPVFRSTYNVSELELKVLVYWEEPQEGVLFARPRLRSDLRYCSSRNLMAVSAFVSITER